MSLQPLDRLDCSLQPLARLADLLLGWLAAILYRSFDIGLVRVFSAVRISIIKSATPSHIPDTVNLNISYLFCIIMTYTLGYLIQCLLNDYNQVCF